MENDLIKKKITEVQNFENGDLGTIIQVQGNQIGQTNVSTLKEDIARSVVDEFTESGLSLNIINPIGVVPTYADLASLTPNLNDAYQVEADGLVYVYTENGFQAEGEGFKVQAEPNGVVEEGNTQAVSGGEVFDSFQVKGNTLGLNNNFDNGLTNWPRGANITDAVVTDGVLTFTGRGGISSVGNRIYQNITAPTDNKIYLAIKAKTNNAGFIYLSNRTGTNGTTFNSTTYYKIYSTILNGVTNVIAFGGGINSVVDVDFVLAYDLTTLFGVGNEPTADEFTTMLGLEDDIYLDSVDINNINLLKKYSYEIPVVNRNINYIQNNLEELKTVNEDISNLLIKKGYYRYYSDTNTRVFFNNDANKSTEPIRVSVGDIFYINSSISSNNTSISFHPTFDEDENIIGALTTSGLTENLPFEVEITQEMYNSGVRYVAFSYRITDDLLLKANRSRTLQNVYDKLEHIEDEIDININHIGNISGIAGMGASLMYNGNNWLEDSCKNLGVNCYNKAVSGAGRTFYFADQLWRGSFCTDEEFEDMDILAIQFANHPDIANFTNLFETSEEYTQDFDIDNPANQFQSTYNDSQQLDYILKKWREMCVSQEFNSDSKWYGVPNGKPFRVILVTNWHDGRVEYNTNIRLVAERWGLPVCEFDKKIGFSKEVPYQGVQVSVKYAEDTIDIGGVDFGWHPLRGVNGRYIQSKMANIFTEYTRFNFLNF